MDSFVIEEESADSWAFLFLFSLYVPIKVIEWQKKKRGGQYFNLLLFVDFRFFIPPKSFSAAFHLMEETREHSVRPSDALCSDYIENRTESKESSRLSSKSKGKRPSIFRREVFSLINLDFFFFISLRLRFLDLC